MKLLLVEDHRELREMTAGFLKECGHLVDAVGTIADMRAAADGAVYDAIVLDLGLPDGDGLALLDDRAGRPPVLIITARDAVSDRVRGLDAGADDYLAKPFDLAELGARVRAIGRRPGGRAAAEAIGNLLVDRDGGHASVAGAPLDLSRRELALLVVLARAHGRIVVRDALDDRLYAMDEPVTPNALEAVVSRLRRRLRDASATVTIETRRGIGYRLRCAERPAA